MTELQNFIDGYGFGISVRNWPKAYRHMESKGHKVCMVNERYLEVDEPHTFFKAISWALDCKGILKEGGMNIAEKMEGSRAL